MDLREFANKRILVVERNKKTALLIKEAFEMVQAELECVKSFKKAEECSLQKKFDLFLFHIDFKNQRSINFLEFLKTAHGSEFQGKIINTKDFFYSERHNPGKEQPEFIKQLFEEEKD